MKKKTRKPEDPSKQVQDWLRKENERTQSGPREWEAAEPQKKEKKRG